MKAWELQNDFGYENLSLTERDDPGEPNPGDILIDIQFVTPNYRDIMMIKGQYNPDQALPLVPFSDASGVVQAVGEDVQRFSVGDRVCPIFAQEWIHGSLNGKKRCSTLGGPRNGTLRKKMNIPAKSAVEVPGYLSDEEAAVLPCAGVTAWNALQKYRKVNSDDVVLLQGTGGVSTFALQFAQCLNARVIQTSSSDSKLEIVKELGADQTINYSKHPGWDEKVMELTDGEGVNQVIEVGGAGTLQKSLRVTGFEGQVSVIGVLTGSKAEVNILPTLMKTLQIQGIFVGSREDFESMLEFMRKQRISPRIDQVFRFEDVKEALKYQEKGNHVGKIAISINE